MDEMEGPVNTAALLKSQFMVFYILIPLNSKFTIRWITLRLPFQEHNPIVKPRAPPEEIFENTIRKKLLLVYY